MADTSRALKRLVNHLCREGARVRPRGAGWIVYPVDRNAAPISLHTSPREPAQAMKHLRREVEAAGHTWPTGL